MVQYRSYLIIGSWRCVIIPRKVAAIYIIKQFIGAVDQFVTRMPIGYTQTPIRYTETAIRYTAEKG